MDFQQLVDSMASMACVISVEKREDHYGKIRIVAGNESYVGSIERPYEGAEMLTKKFVPNSEYTNYLAQDLNFEHFCYQAAVHKKNLHSYTHPRRMPVWFDLSFLPLDADDETCCYCLYVMDIDYNPDPETMSMMSSTNASKVLATAIQMRSATDFNAGMNDVIKGIRRLCEAEQCCIILVDELNQSCSVLCEALVDGSSLRPASAFVNDEFYRIASTWDAAIAGSSCLLAKDDHDMDVLQQRIPVWHDVLRVTGIKSFALFPLETRNGLLGYIWALNFNPDNSVDIKETLEASTLILASEIDSHLLLSHLKAVSSHDLLTGLLNRNEMNNVIDKLSDGSLGRGESVGIVYADLNGLKKVNDRDGHNTGDSLLKDASKALLEVFGASEVFRAGGDEFVVICIGATEQGLAEKTEALRDAAQRSGTVTFALGSCFEEDARNVSWALRMADERMYANKRAYYERHPEENRRV